jgi:signal transduction histidine kinase
VPTQVTISGHRRPLPATVDLAAYHIVQESLTNVLRHAGGASALVAISYADDAMTISVDDDGGGRTGVLAGTNGYGKAPGHGILGMRERAHALGGELQAGPRPGGGFRVSARLRATARKLGGGGDERLYGAGLLNAAAATAPAGVPPADQPGA